MPGKRNRVSASGLLRLFCIRPHGSRWLTPWARVVSASGLKIRSLAAPASESWAFTGDSLAGAACWYLERTPTLWFPHRAMQDFGDGFSLYNRFAVSWAIGCNEVEVV